jgi:hypothetical protein
MSFRSRAHPDQRRRRVILDETLAEEPRCQAAVPFPSKRTKRYGDEALRDAQPRITDFLPATRKRLAVALVLLALVDIALIACHSLLPRWEAQRPELPWGLLDALNPAGLAQIAALLQWMAVVCCGALIYAIRRHRLDDLRGTSQVWIWAVAVGALGLLLVATDLADLISFGLSRIPQLPATSHPRIYFWYASAVVFIPTLARLLIEVRHVRSAQVLLVAALLFALAREVLFVGWLELPMQLASSLFVGATLASTTSLLAALLLYGRYVKLDASGAFGNRKRKRLKKKDDLDSVGAGASETRIDGPQESAPRPNTIGAQITAAQTRSPDDDDRRGGPLSKAQRKAMRR